MFEIRLQDTRVFREAQEERAQEIAFNLLRLGIAIEVIAEATGLTMVKDRPEVIAQVQ